MHFIVSASALSSALTTAQSAIARKPQTQLLGCVRISAEADLITLSSTDLDLAVRVRRKAQVKKPGAVAIPIGIISNVVRALDGDVELKLDKQMHIEVKSGKTKARLFALDATDFPELPSSESESPVSRADFLELIDQTLYAASTDETRYNLNGVFLDDRAAVATDGHRMSVVRMPDGLDGIPSSITLPRRGMAELKRVLPHIADEQISIGAEGSHVHVVTVDMHMSMRLVDGDYPPYREVIPSKPTTTVKLQRDELISALRRVSTLASSDSLSVTLGFNSEELSVECATVDAGDINTSVAVQTEGERVTIACSPQYLIDALSRHAGAVIVRLNGALQPIVFVDADDVNRLTSIVMPMRS